MHVRSGEMFVLVAESQSLRFAHNVAGEKLVETVVETEGYAAPFAASVCATRRRPHRPTWTWTRAWTESLDATMGDPCSC